MADPNWCVWCGTLLGSWPKDANGFEQMSAFLTCPKCGRRTHYDSGRFIRPYKEDGNGWRCPNCEYVHGLDVAGNLWGANPPLPCPQCGIDLRNRKYYYKDPGRQPLVQHSAEYVPPRVVVGGGGQPASAPGSRSAVQKPVQRVTPPTQQPASVQPPRVTPVRPASPQPRPKPDMPAQTGRPASAALRWTASVVLLALSAGVGVAVGALLFSAAGFGFLPYLAEFGLYSRLLMQAAIVIGFVLLALGFLILPMWSRIASRNGQQPGYRQVRAVKMAAIIWVLAMLALLVVLALGNQFGRNFGDVLQSSTPAP